MREFCRPKVGVVARWMSSGGGGEVGRGGGMELFLIGMVDGGGMLGGGGSIMVGGRVLSTTTGSATALPRGDAVTSSLARENVESTDGRLSLLLMIDGVRTRLTFPNVPVESLIGDLTILAAAARAADGGLTGDGGIYWNGLDVAPPMRWKLSPLFVGGTIGMAGGAGGFHSSVCTDISLSSGLGTGGGTMARSGACVVACES